MTPDPLAGASAVALQARLAGGGVGVRVLADALLERIAALEPAVRAWACLRPGHVRAQADALDAALQHGDEAGPLFGLPVGVKDIVDTADLPTEHGTVLHAGRMPRADASVVQRLRAAGGLLMGKTVTTELATYAPGPTRHPQDSAHTPGGSSSGSAAAVAAGMVPLAIGTQTNGSVIRPASFCGVVGYKPTFGLIPRGGVLTQSPSFDQVGVFARDVPGAALLAEVLAGPDGVDAMASPPAWPPLLRLATQAPSIAPRLGWFATPFWDRVAPDAQSAFERLLRHMGERVARVEAPSGAAEIVDDHRLVMEAEIAGSYADEYERGREQLSTSLCGQIERGREVRAVAHRAALARLARAATRFDEALAGFDAWLTPAALGTAPRGLDATGDPIMCTLWSATGLPTITLPLLRGDNGLPIGVQLVGRRGDDARLLRTAHWLMGAAAPTPA